MIFNDSMFVFCEQYIYGYIIMFSLLICVTNNNIESFLNDKPVKYLCLVYISVWALINTHQLIHLFICKCGQHILPLVKYHRQQEYTVQYKITFFCSYF